MHETIDYAVVPRFEKYSNLFAKIMVHEYLRFCHGLKRVVLGVNASAGSVLGDAILVVDVMTIIGVEE